MPLRQGLSRPPVIRSETDDVHRHATWLELFYDLAFVAVLGRISHALAVSHDPEIYGRFFLLFIPVWWAWVGQTFYLSRFDSDDITHRLSTFLQIAIVAAMALGIDPAIAGNTSMFIGAYVALRVVLVAQYLFAGYHIPRARLLTTRYSIGFSIAIAVWIISAFVPPPWQYIFWGLGIAIDFITPNLCKTLNLKFPPHPEHIPERFGLFTIIVLGEAIIADVSSLADIQLSPTGLVLGILGLVMAFCLWWIYFEGVKGANARVPKSNEDINKYRLWLYGHLPLHASILLTAVFVERTVHYGFDNSLIGLEAYLLPAAVAVAMLFKHVLYISNTDATARKINRHYVFPHWVATICAFLLIPLGPILLCGYLLIGYVTIWIAHFFLTLRPVPEELS